MILSIDIGGTSIKFGIIKNNIILESNNLEINSDSNIIQICNELYIDYNNKYDIEGISLCTPGFPDEEKMLIKAGSPNLQDINNKEFFKDVDIKKTIINDVNAQGYYFNKHLKYKNFIVVTVGTGIGGSIIINNKVITGKNGWAGEIGHISTIYNRKECNCTRKCCSENSGSVRALVENTSSKNGYDFIIKLKKDKLSYNEKNVYELWKLSLAELCGNLINIFNPEAIVFSGALLSNNNFLVEEISKNAKDFCFDIMYENCEIISLKQGKDAGILGAYLYYIDKYFTS